MRRHFASQCFAVLICLLVPLAPSSLAQRNEVLEEVELIGAGKVENTSGVWVDGQYLGYLKELKGSKRILLYRGRSPAQAKISDQNRFDQGGIAPSSPLTSLLKNSRHPRRRNQSL